MKRAEREVLAVVRGLPEKFVAHQRSFRRVWEGLEFFPLHNREHHGQIKAALESARQPAAVAGD
jgi:hypothetical protein